MSRGASGGGKDAARGGRHLPPGYGPRPSPPAEAPKALGPDAAGSARASGVPEWAAGAAGLRRGGKSAPAPGGGAGGSGGAGGGSGGGPGGASPAPGGPSGSRYTHVAQPTMRARKVRGGIKLATKSGPVSTAWAGQRWLRLVEDLADGAVLQEGIEYARAGQTRALNLNPGHIHARVQGRMPQAYAVDIRLPVLTFQQWDEVIALMVNEARPLAALLSGEVPASIEDSFSPLRLHLFPSEASHLAATCSCAQARAQLEASMAAAGQKAQPGSPAAALTSDALHKGPWCKHVCCVMALVAERLGEDAFLMMALRGLGKDDLLERLRQKRALSGARGGGQDLARDDAGAHAGAAGPSSPSDRPVPVYTPRVAGVTDVTLGPLDEHLESFWTAGPELDQLDLAMDPPPVSHALLRRLGPSPFPTGKFPLLGLLSTCYSVISETMAAPGSRADEQPGAA